MPGPLEALNLPLPVQSDRPAEPRAAALQWLSQGQESEWDSFVAGQLWGSLYHTSEWKRVIEQAFPHIRGGFVVLREGAHGEIRAGLPTYRVKSWLLGKRLVSVPFATVCEPLVHSAEEWNLLAPELREQCGRTRSKKVEIRAALRGPDVPAFFVGESSFRRHLLPLDQDFAALSLRFEKRSVRQKAEKARRASVVVRERSDVMGMKESHSLLAATRRRLRLPPMPYRFFAALHAHLRAEHLKIFLAYQGARPVACHIVLIFKDQWLSEYSGSADGALSGVNQLLYWETIRRACAEGAREFSFGRTSVSNPGLLSYKRRWGTIEEELTDYAWHPNEGHATLLSERAGPLETSLVYRLCKQAVARAPLPVCKMIGNFCYRHLG